MSHTREEKLQAFDKVLDVLETLRVKCPWDRKQTNESLRPNTIEETYELCDALMAEDNANICKELGDVLLHVVFYSKIGEEKEAFDFADVCTKLTDKLIYRHPQDIPHGGGELFHRLAGIAPQYPVQRDAPFHHAVKQRGAEGALLPGELGISHQALQHQVGVAALPEHLREAPQGGHSCIGHGLIPVPSPADDDQP